MFGLFSRECLAEDSDGFDGFLDVVHAQDACSLRKRNHVEGCRSVERFGRCRSEKFVYHRFAGDSNEDGQLQFVENVEAAHQLIILVERLAETESGVDDDVADACFGSFFDLLAEKFQDVGGEIFIVSGFPRMCIMI